MRKILFLAVVLLLVGGGIYYWQEVRIKGISTADWKTYEGPGFQFQYPPNLYNLADETIMFYIQNANLPMHRRTGPDGMEDSDEDFATHGYVIRADLVGSPPKSSEKLVDPRFDDIYVSTDMDTPLTKQNYFKTYYINIPSRSDYLMLDLEVKCETNCDGLDPSAIFDKVLSTVKFTQ